MSTVKVEKDVFIRDRFGVRIRVFTAGMEVEKGEYDKAVTPQDHPTSTGVFIPKKAEVETKTLPEVEKTEVVGEPTEELEAQEENIKKPAEAKAKAKK